VIQAIANGLSDSFAGYAISDLVLQLLVAPLNALAAAVLYFELRGRRAEPNTTSTEAAPPAPAG
jgi:hypothetical protein